MNLLTQIFDYLTQFFDEFITAYIVLCIIGVIFYVIAYSYIYLVGSIIVWLEKNVKNKIFNKKSFDKERSFSKHLQWKLVIVPLGVVNFLIGIIGLSLGSVIFLNIVLQPFAYFINRFLDM